MQNSRNSTVIASGIGTFVEWYDFFLYGTSSALVFNKLFFPQFDPRTGTLLALLTYASGFLARPLGGLVSGHFGDRLGRRNVLLGTLLLMGLATFLIGLVPTYASIGIWGAVILVVLRLIQGFAAGGEWSGALVLVSESTPENRRGFFGSILTSVNQAAFIVGTFILSIVNGLLTDEQFLAWGWRIPFLVSIVIVAIGVYIRLRVPESPEFEELQRQHRTASAPLVEALKTPRNIFALFAVRVGENTYYYAVSVFAISYCVSYLQVSRTVPLQAISIGAAVAVVGALLGGALADRIGSRLVMGFGLVFQLVWIVPFFLLCNTRDPSVIMLATIVAIVAVNSAVDAPQAKFVMPLFPTRFRYSGVAAGREVATIIGGLTPAIATALIGVDGSPWIFATFLMGCSLLGLIGLVAARPVVASSPGQPGVPAGRPAPGLTG